MGKKVIPDLIFLNLFFTLFVNLDFINFLAHIELH